jgi:hypothetical protein
VLPVYYKKNMLKILTAKVMKELKTLNSSSNWQKSITLNSPTNYYQTEL